MRRYPWIVPLVALILVGAATFFPGLMGGMKPSVEVRWRGTTLELPPRALRALGVSVEKLARGSMFAGQSRAPEAPRELEILVSYHSPLALKLPIRDPRTVQVRQLALYLSPTENDGWPTLLAVSGKEMWFFAKYDGGLTLDILCSQELEPYASPAIRSNCHLAPSRRRR